MLLNFFAVPLGLKMPPLGETKGYWPHLETKGVKKPGAGYILYNIYVYCIWQDCIWQDEIIYFLAGCFAKIYQMQQNSYTRSFSNGKLRDMPIVA